MITKSRQALSLTDAERERLLSWVRRRKIDQALALRARIVLMCADGHPGKVVAERLEIWPQTVSKWRSRFIRLRLAGLEDAPRPGPPKKVDQARIDAVLARLVMPPPAGLLRWTTRAMAREMELSQSSISKIWRALGLSSDKTRRI